MRGRDDVDPGFEDLHVEVLVRKDAVEGEYVGPGGDDVVDRAGGDDAVGRQAGDFTRIAADLFCCLAM